MPAAQHPADPAHALQAIRSQLPPELQQRLCRASELDKQRRGRLRGEPLPTMVRTLDLLLGGGLPRGALVELVGRGSCGRFAILLAALRTMTDIGEAVALVDQGEHLDPQAAAEIGVDLERLLWLRPQRLPDTLAAAEMLVSTGFPLVAADVGLPPVRGRAPMAAWLRLARSCQARQAVVLITTPYRLSGCAATAVVAAGGGRGSWSGDVGTTRLLHGLTARLTTLRRRGHRPGEKGRATLILPEAAFAPAAETVPPADRFERKVRYAEAL